MVPTLVGTEPRLVGHDVNSRWLLSLQVVFGILLVIMVEFCNDVFS